MKNRMLWLIILILIISTSIMAQTPEENIAVAKSYGQALDGHNIDTILSHFAEDGVQDATVFPAPSVGHDQLRLMYEDLLGANPDWSSIDGAILAVDEFVIVEHISTGTNVRDADGVAWQWPHMDVFEIEDGKIRKLMTYGDYASILVQLGLVPAPEAPDLTPSILVPDPEATGLSPLEANAEMVARWNNHDPAATAQMVRGDTQTFVGPMGTFLDRTQVAAMNEMYFAGFSDTTITPIRTIDLGDGWVAFEHVVRATHDGAFMGVPASGFPIDVRAAWLTHFDSDGLITAMSIYYDNLTLLNQMTTPPIPLDGIWVSATPTPFGNLLLTTTYVAQDAAKTRYSGSLDEVNPMPVLSEIFPDADPNPKWAGGQAVMVSRDKYEATYLGYARKLVDTEMGSMMEIVGLFTINAHFEVTGPDSLQGQGTGSYYLAIQDADGDGYPDEGEEPIACVPWQWTGKKLGILPGCVPPPMPEP